MRKIILPKLKCKRCGHIWHPRKEELPLRCPKCGSPYWDKLREKGLELRDYSNYF